MTPLQIQVKSTLMLDGNRNSVTYGEKTFCAFWQSDDDRQWEPPEISARSLNHRS